MANKSYEQITDKIIAALDKGIVPWHKPWRSLSPQSAVTGKAYQGVNRLLLSFSPYSDPRWLTYRGAMQLGGHVKQGERSEFSIVKFETFEKSEEGKDGSEHVKRVPWMKAYAVFNVEQCEGLDLPQLVQVVSDKSVVEKVEDLIDGYAARPRIEHGGDQALYNPVFDTLKVPHPETFDITEEYAATMAHELIHSTGHFTRLNRRAKDEIRGFGSQEYSKEELIAEIGAAFLCADMQIDTEGVFDNSVAYINAWKKVITGSDKIVIEASSAAQKATVFILGEKVIERDEANSQEVLAA
jgi:antirestriction protein ArdC